MKKMLVFDMDGTIADLYGQEKWLEKILSNDVSPYIDCKPLVDIRQVADILQQLKKQGYETRVISWLRKGSDKAYDKQVRKAKKDWLAKHGFKVDKIHIVKYGTKKHHVIKDKQVDATIFDDDANVREHWNLGMAINPQTTDIITTLKKLIT